MLAAFQRVLISVIEVVETNAHHGKNIHLAWDEKWGHMRREVSKSVSGMCNKDYEKYCCFILTRLSSCRQQSTTKSWNRFKFYVWLNLRANK